MPHVLYAAEARLYRPGPVANPLLDEYVCAPGEFQRRTYRGLLVLEPIAAPEPP
jgi:hypothetical protein